MTPARVLLVAVSVAAGYALGVGAYDLATGRGWLALLAAALFAGAAAALSFVARRAP